MRTQRPPRARLRHRRGAAHDRVARHPHERARAHVPHELRDLRVAPRSSRAAAGRKGGVAVSADYEQRWGAVMAGVHGKKRAHEYSEFLSRKAVSHVATGIAEPP